MTGSLAYRTFSKRLLPRKRAMMKTKALLPILAAALVFSLSSCAHTAATPNTTANLPANLPKVHQASDRISVAVKDGWLTFQTFGPRIIHVVFSKQLDEKFSPSLDILPLRAGKPSWKLTGPDQLTVFTPSVQARITLSDGRITFLDASGKTLLSEAGRTMTPALVDGVKTFHVQQEWQPNAGESLYGLGQNQLDLTNIKNYDIDLWQHNGTIAIPFLVSTRGYGILWDNPSYTRFGDLRPWKPIPATDLLDNQGKAGGLTATYFSDAFQHSIARRTEAQIHIEERPEVNNIPMQLTATPLDRLKSGGAVRWQGSILAPRTGWYEFQTFSNGGIKVWINGKLVINRWRQAWLPWLDIARANFQAGNRYSIKVEWTRDQGTVVRLDWKPAEGSANGLCGDRASEQQLNSDSPVRPCATSLWSDMGKKIDYYFIAGRSIDQVIGGYRTLTGPAPMMPIWSFGLWQSRERYKTAQESLDVVRGFRKRHIPFDNIVQDWMYWPPNTWGSHRFDPSRFPDPDRWIANIHALHARLMISVWGKFYTGTRNFAQMQAHGYLYQPNLKQGIKDWLNHVYTFFDAFNPGARQLFWDQVKPALFDRGIDAWWLDATEPDIMPTPTLAGQMTHMTPTALGPGRKVLNAYSIMMGKTFYNNQRKAAPNRRVFILTRSGFLGQQRYAEASWSGDTTSAWTTMKAQIVAGISFCMSGVPYWTMDIGGFTAPARFKDNNPANIDEWRELFTRWFEFGAFVPLLRVHGEFPYREMWQFGGDNSPAYKAQLESDRLRYRLLPYIYSIAGDVHFHGGTMMRGLAMDFPRDPLATQVTDQYMFGPAFLVSPVTVYKARSRQVYLPKDSAWYDFWTGKNYAGGQTINAPAPFDQLPLFIRAGSIIPVGPDLQYTTEKPADPITLFVYTGANGRFNLYEDDGVTNAYENGQFSQIPITWNQAGRRLNISARRGAFPEMLKTRTFKIVFVSPSHPEGFSFNPAAEKIVRYHGAAISIREPD